MPAFPETTPQMFAFVIMIMTRVIASMNVSMLQRSARGIHSFEWMSSVIIFHRLDVLWILRGRRQR